MGHFIRSIPIGLRFILGLTMLMDYPHYIKCAHHHFLQQRVNFFFFVFYELAFFFFFFIIKIAYYYIDLITTKF